MLELPEFFLGSLADKGFTGKSLQLWIKPRIPTPDKILLALLFVNMAPEIYYCVSPVSFPL